DRVIRTDATRVHPHVRRRHFICPRLAVHAELRPHLVCDLEIFASHSCSYALPGSVTIACPGDVFFPSGFSVQISSSTKFLPPSLYFLVITPRQRMSWFGSSIPRYEHPNRLI